VTLDEALNELGIDDEAGVDGARRAYLRLLKKRKPEVDREGFMRLREAYELAKPYFEELELCRVVDEAMDAEAARPDGGRDVVRLETPAGVVYLHRAPPLGPDELAFPDEPTSEQDEPPIDEDKPAVENHLGGFEPNVEDSELAHDAVSEGAPETQTQAPIEPAVDSAVKAVDTEPTEPSIDELIAAGKLKKAARLMGRQYRVAIDQASIDVDVPAPHQAVLLLLRMHEKNRVEEAKVFEKEFAEWLSSTGASVRIMAGPVSVMWLLVRELGALSKSFPLDLRESISTAIIAGKLDDAQRRARWFQMRDPDRARNAALDLHAHAPTLATLLGETLAPTATRAAPGRSSSGGNWGYGIAFVVLLNLMRVFVNSPNDTQTSYRGKSDLGEYYRPKPSPAPESIAPSISVRVPDGSDAGLAVDDSFQIDKRWDEILKVAQQLETRAERSAELEHWIVQRARFVRASIEKRDCGIAEAELNGFVKDMVFLSDPFKAALLPNAKKIDSMLRAECHRNDTVKTSPDGGPAKKP
jgi:hypothetical protein